MAAAWLPISQSHLQYTFPLCRYTATVFDGTSTPLTGLDSNRDDWTPRFRQPLLGSTAAGVVLVTGSGFAFGGAFLPNPPLALPTTRRRRLFVAARNGQTGPIDLIAGNLLCRISGSRSNSTYYTYNASYPFEQRIPKESKANL